MNLTNREQERLLIYTASQIATSRRAKGLKLNYPEAISIISAFILEGAREGKSVSDLMVEATQILKEEDVMEGVAGMIDMVQTEATFDDGTKLVTVHQPIATSSSFVGEYLFDGADIVLNEGSTILTLSVENTGDRPVQVGSHFHFFECNASLQFEREKAYGYRLHIASGTSVRFEPGSNKEVSLIAYRGERYITGFNALVNGHLDDEATKTQAMKNLAQFLKDEK